MSDVPLLYLDQKDVSYLASGKVVSSDTADRLHALLVSGRLKVVLSFPHVWETSNYENALSREAIVQYVDSRLRHRVWLWEMRKLYSAELAKCMAEDAGDKGAVIHPFDPTFFPQSREDVALERHEFGAAVGVLRGNREERERVRMRLANWPAWREMGREAHGGKCIPDKKRRRGLLKFVPEQDIHGRPLGHASRVDFIKQLDLSRCPAIQLDEEVQMHYYRDTVCSIQSSEPWDYQHLLAVPYCSVTTLDRRMHSLVLQTGAGKEYRDRIACTVGEALDKLGL